MTSWDKLKPLIPLTDSIIIKKLYFSFYLQTQISYNKYLSSLTFKCLNWLISLHQQSSICTFCSPQICNGIFILIHILYILVAGGGGGGNLLKILFSGFTHLYSGLPKTKLWTLDNQKLLRVITYIFGVVLDRFFKERNYYIYACIKKVSVKPKFLS